LPRLPWLLCRGLPSAVPKPNSSINRIGAELKVQLGTSNLI
jgi:hypothetical protein